MYDVQRRMAEEHQADLRHEAERRHMSTLARCCSGVGNFFRDMTRRAHSRTSR
ncbi:MAG: hypothetical protein ACXWDI_00035 [Nocardioides sp.]